MISTKQNPLLFLHLMILSSTTLNFTNAAVSGQTTGRRSTVPQYNSPVTTSSSSSVIGPSSAHRNLVGVLYEEVAGESAEEVCQSFKIAYFSQVIADRLGTVCSCEEYSVDGSFYLFSCVDKCEICYDGVEDCAIYTLDGTLKKNTGSEGGFFMEFAKACNNWNDASFDSAQVCYIEDYAQFVGTGLKVTVNDVACNSVAEVEDCAISIDCSNLNYGDDMNPCDPNTLKGQGLFEHFFKSITNDSLEIGQCSSGVILGTGMIFVVPFLTLILMPW